MKLHAGADLNLALIQMRVTDVKADNLKKAEYFIRRAKDQGADLAILPEMFNCPYSIDFFKKFAEMIPEGPTCETLSSLAADLGLSIVGGSIPEKDQEGRIYNTCPVFDRGGNLAARHRKAHLFDVNLPDMVFRESAVLSPGDRATMVDLLGWRIGLAICYDVRFPEFIRRLTLEGAALIVLPGAFNHVTGPAHWELMLRARAVENTVYLTGVSPAPLPQGGYPVWGHSRLIDPYGETVAALEAEEGMVIGRISAERLQDIRARLPLLAQRREDIY